jgi:flagellar protein FliJ
MNRHDTQALQVVLQHAEGERDAARQALNQCEEAAARADAQAQQLDTYRAEFRQRWTTQFAQSGTPELLQYHHGFAQRLDVALEQQARQCAAAAQRVAQARQVLMGREQKLAAVRKLIERRLASQQLVLQRRDQKQTDEAAQRAAWNARAEADQF